MTKEEVINRISRLSNARDVLDVAPYISSYPELTLTLCRAVLSKAAEGHPQADAMAKIVLTKAMGASE